MTTELKDKTRIVNKELPLEIIALFEGEDTLFLSFRGSLVFEDPWPEDYAFFKGASQKVDFLGTTYQVVSDGIEGKFRKLIYRDSSRLED